jgi:predicted N-acetyltransferase YhbS
MIETIAESALTAKDEAQIAHLLARSFDTDFGGRSYFQQRHHLRLVTRQDGKIIGHMGLLFRAIRLGSQLTDIAGLADVCTDPDHRGKGVAQQLLTAAITNARASRATFFLLFGNANIYSGNHFRPFANPITYLDLRGARTGEVKTEAAEQLMVLPLQDGQIWPATVPVDLLGTLF